MPQLQRQIRQLERKMDSEQMALEKRREALKVQFESPAFLMLGLLSGFAAGYYLGREKPETTEDEDGNKKKPSGFSLIKEIHSHVNLLLPLLFR